MPEKETVQYVMIGKVIATMYIVIDKGDGKVILIHPIQAQAIEWFNETARMICAMENCFTYIPSTYPYQLHLEKLKNENKKENGNETKADV